jgi:hypothetical protein
VARPTRPTRADAVPRTRARPRRAALVAIAGAIAVGLLLTGCSGDDTEQSSETTTPIPPSTTTTTEPPLDAGRQLEPLYFVPSVGDCFDRRKVPGADNKQVDVILALDCQLPHQYEIFGTIEYPLPEDGDTTWPGDEAVRNYARAHCPELFEDYVGKPYETSVLEIGHLLPPEKNFYANQVIGCYVYDPTQDHVVEGRAVQGRTAGTAQGTAR